MQRTQKQFTLKEIAIFKQQLLIWAQQYEAICWLDSNQYNQKYSSFDAKIGRAHV